MWSKKVDNMYNDITVHIASRPCSRDYKIERLVLAPLVLNFKTLPFTLSKQKYRAPSAQASTMNWIYSQSRRVTACLLYETNISLNLFTSKVYYPLSKIITPYLLRFRISFLWMTYELW